MNYKDWLAKYYPTPAKDVAKSDEAMLLHAELKWKGLKPDVLEQYDVLKSGSSLLHKEENGNTRAVLQISASTCALCIVYYDEESPIDANCDGCPLNRQRGVPCDKQTHYEQMTDKHSPYQIMLYANDPLPMLLLIKKALKAL